MKLLHEHWGFIFVFAFFSAMLFFFPLKLLSPESYFFSAAIEGYYNLSSTFQTFQNDVLLPDISRAHPNHPIPHYIAGIVFDFTKIPAMDTLRYLNILGALGTLFAFYLCLLQLFQRKSVIIFGLLSLAFSFSFWQEALVAEVHLISLAFIVGAFYFFIRCYKDNERKYYKNFLIATILFAAAVSYHLFASYVSIAIIIAILSKADWRRHWRLYLLSAFIVLFFCLVFYVGFLVWVLKIHSIHEYWGTFFIYKYLQDKYYSGLTWFVVFGKSFLHSIVYGYNQFGVVSQIILVIFLVFGYFSVIKSRWDRPIKVLVFTWPLVYLLMGVILDTRADGLSVWLFCLPSTIVALCSTFNYLAKNAGAQIYIVVFIAAISGVNFLSTVWPNSQLNRSDFIFIDAVPELMQDSAKNSSEKYKKNILTFVGNQSLTFPELREYVKKNGSENLQIVNCCNRIEEKINKIKEWLSQHSNGYIIDDTFTEWIPKILHDKKISYNLIFGKSSLVPEHWIPSSIYFPTRFGGYRKQLRVWKFISQ
ncbi:MAG TPA: hypothetical protein PLY93_04370 [Turneriella sp.]|nr:hypothetical protein [Turneriella sp.]